MVLKDQLVQLERPDRPDRLVRPVQQGLPVQLVILDHSVPKVVILVLLVPKALPVRTEFGVQQVQQEYALLVRPVNRVLLVPKDPKEMLVSSVKLVQPVQLV
jgi:hypothetical protein